MHNEGWFWGIHIFWWLFWIILVILFFSLLMMIKQLCTSTFYGETRMTDTTYAGKAHSLRLRRLGIDIPAR
jgi:hypothetical protein